MNEVDLYLATTGLLTTSEKVVIANRSLQTRSDLFRMHDEAMGEALEHFRPTSIAATGRTYNMDFPGSSDRKYDDAGAADPRNDRANTDADPEEEDDQPQPHGLVLALLQIGTAFASTQIAARLYYS